MSEEGRGRTERRVRLAPSRRGVWLPALLLIGGGWLGIGSGWAATGLVWFIVAVAMVIDWRLGAVRVRRQRIASAEVVRLAHGTSVGVEIDVTWSGTRPGRVGLALTVPAALGLEREQVEFRVPSGAEHVRAAFEVRARERGRHRGLVAHVEVDSPWGLWLARSDVPLAMEVRVYPDVRRERAGLAALFLRRAGAGRRPQRQLGKGREFEQLRDYVSGDDFADIHWRASARRGHPVTKVFQVERTQEVYVLVDHSRLSGRRFAGGDEVLERCLTTALVLGRAAERQGDRFGLVTFSDRVTRFVRASAGPGHYGACRDALYGVRSALVEPDFEELAAAVAARLRRRALLVFLTSLDSPPLAAAFGRAAELLRRRHVVQVVMVQPDAMRPLFVSGDVQHADDVCRELAGHLMWREIHDVRGRLGRIGVRLDVVPSGRVAVEAVNRYLEVKARQGL